MCGHETTPSSTPRIGARVDFFSPSRGGSLGNLLFLNPSTPSSTHATHVRFFNPSSSQTHTTNEQVLVSIHKTGDLTTPLCDAGVMQEFTLHNTSSSSAPDFEMALGQALSLNVGHDGIIGRRVSMRRGGEVVGDGIVGFNCLPTAVDAGCDSSSGSESDSTS